MPTLHKAQGVVYKDLMLDRAHRYATLCTSRGFGKTHLCAAITRTAAQELVMMPKDIPNKNIAIIMPTLDQGMKAYQPILENVFEINRLATRKATKNDPSYKLVNDVRIDFVSWEAVERMRGQGYYFIIWDEVTSCTKGASPLEAWDNIIYPCISTRWSPMHAVRFGEGISPGRAIFVSTPKGYDFFYDMMNTPEKNSDYVTYVYDYTASPLLDPEEVSRARATMDPIAFAREYLADPKETGNSVFYSFDRKRHVKNDIPMPEKNEVIHACIDFNVGIQATSFFVIRGSEMHFIDEMRGQPNTEMLAQAIKARYPDHKIIAYPDPSGRAHKSSAPIGQTDFTILASHGIQPLARKGAPPMVDSVNAVNAKLLNGYGEAHMFFHPKCGELIKSMERTRWLENRPDSATIDKSEGVEHFSDGVRYATEYLYPVRTSFKASARSNRW